MHEEGAEIDFISSNDSPVSSISPLIPFQPDGT